jgi:hypothetical protein
MTSTIQSVTFDKKQWTTTKARKWGVTELVVYEKKVTN